MQTAKVATPAETTDKPARLYYIDWLRVLAMLSIFLFHNARFYDSISGWHVKNASTGVGPTILVGFLNHWMMPLFFILSGAAVYYALCFRTAGAFIKERVLRILIPLVLVGIFVLAPPQVYLERLTQSQFTGSFFQFYPHYFDGMYGFGGNFAWAGMHLWYLLYLFIFSLITLPLLLPSKRTGMSLISRLATLFEKPWALLLLFLPLAAVDILIDVAGLGFTRATGGWSFFSYILFFIYGYLIFSNTRIQQSVRTYSTIVLAVAVVLSVYGLILQFVIVPRGSSGTLPYEVIMLLRGLRVWCWILAILGLGSRFLNSNTRFLEYANVAVLPFYVLHQTVILIIGFYVVQWSLTIGAKYSIVTGASFVAILVIYELLVRRFNVLRFLFGMRLKKRFAG